MLFYAVTAIIILFFILYPYTKWEAAVILFVAFIIQYSLLGENEQLFGFIDHRSVVSIILIFSAYNYKTIKISKQNFDYPKRISVFLTLFFMIFIVRYIDIKEGLLHNNLDIGLQLKRLTRDLIFVFAVILIIKRLYDLRTLKGLEKGLLLGLGIALFSMIFYKFFLKSGFSLHTGYHTDESEQYLRLTGFLGMNANQAGALFNIVYGYVLGKMEKSKKTTFSYYLLISFIIIGIFIVASRTGLIVLLLLTILYIFRTSTKMNQSFLNSIVVITLGLAFFHFFGDYMETRVNQQISGEFDTFSARQGYWILYLNDIINNPEYLIIGNLGDPTYHRSVHNTYLEYLFYGGVITLLIVMYKFWQIYKSRVQYKLYYLSYTPIYILLALMISWITGAGQFNYYFIILIAASAGIPMNYAKHQIDYFH